MMFYVVFMLCVMVDLFDEIGLCVLVYGVFEIIVSLFLELFGDT